MSHRRVLRDDPLKWNVEQFAQDHGADRPAHVAVMRNDLAALRDLHLAALTTPLMQYAEFTPLALAVALRRRPAIAQLLALGVPVDGVFNVTFTSGDSLLFGTTSALQLAAWRGDSDMVAALLAAQPDTGPAAMSGHTLGFYAALNDDVAVLQMLLDRWPHLAVPAPVHVAAENPNEAVISLLLQRAGSGDDVVSARTNDGSVPLHVAARNENVKVAAALIAAGADVNARNRAHQTPSHVAAANCNAAVIALLLAHGADVNAADAKQIKPCDTACANANADVLAALLAHGGEFGALDVALFNAVENCHPLALQSLLKQHRLDLTVRNKDGLSPLHLAARCSSGEVVQLLLDAGVDIDEQCTRYQKNALQFACTNKDLGALRVLVAGGARIYAADRMSTTALHTACWADNMAALSVLATAGVDVVAAAKCDASLLCSAASAHTSTNVLRHLIRSGVDLSARNRRRETACFRASSRGLEALFAAGANLNVSHSIGETAPYPIAIGDLYSRPVLTLLAAGADVGADLLTAARNLSPDTLSLLVAGGALDASEVKSIEAKAMAKAIGRIAQRQFELLRWRGLEIAVGLQPLGLSALVTCEILSFAFAPQVSLIPFHRVWKIVTTVKHLKKE
jgi:ankyrin repeat protein